MKFSKIVLKTFILAALLFYATSPSWAEETLKDKPVSDGKPEIISFPDTGEIKISSFRQQTAGWQWQCFVLIEGKQIKTQKIVTVGAGQTEALTCHNVKAIGRLPSPEGMHRFGLIYKVASPNSELDMPAIVYSTVKDSNWMLDETLVEQMELRENNDTIPAIRSYLKRNKS